MKPRVAVVGAGAAGVLAAVRLVESDMDVALVDPCPSPGRGVAYSTGRAQHLLNTPAGKMSAYEADPDHFVRWVSRRLGRTVAAGEFLPRHHFGTYLGEVLGERCRRVRARAVGVGASSLLLSSGERLSFDAAVLALGVLPPSTSWAPASLRSSSRFVADPWAPFALAGVPDTSDVLLVGTGLTMVDVAMVLDRPWRTVHAVSRHGLLPRRHAPAAPAVPPELDGDLASVRRFLLRQVRVDREWRSVVDSLRSLTVGLWQRWSQEDRARFLAEDMRYWDVRRHRMPPAVADQVRRLRRAGRLVVHRGEVSGYDSGQVSLSSGTSLPVGAVVNCTGSQADLRQAKDPLITGLVDAGLARYGPFGMGLDTAPDGRLSDAPLWTLGSLRRGTLWESTAFPEIRAQATDLATSLQIHLTTSAQTAA